MMKYTSELFSVVNIRRSSLQQIYCTNNSNMMQQIHCTFFISLLLKTKIMEQYKPHKSILKMYVINTKLISYINHGELVDLIEKITKLSKTN